MPMPFAQVVIRSYSLGELLIGVVILAACCALVWVALRQFQVTIPQWVLHVFWIVVVAIVVIFALRLVLSL
jgi:hypothetical protein